MIKKIFNSFSHINIKNQPSIVDVSCKEDSKRYAKAQSIVILPKEIWIKLNNNEIFSKKGPIIHTAIIAGIMAVKNTSNLIPFCHPLQIEDCQIHAIFGKNKTLLLECEVKIYGKTGVEMEALLGASIAALTVYDMCKSISNKIVIEKIYLLKKTGGKSDFTRN